MSLSSGVSGGAETFAEAPSKSITAWKRSFLSVEASSLLANCAHFGAPSAQSAWAPARRVDSESSLSSASSTGTCFVSPARPAASIINTFRSRSASIFAALRSGAEAAGFPISPSARAASRRRPSRRLGSSAMSGLTASALLMRPRPRAATMISPVSSLDNERRKIRSTSASRTPSAARNSSNGARPLESVARRSA